MRNNLFLVLLIFLTAMQQAASGQSYTVSLTSEDNIVCKGDSIPAYIYFAGGTAPWNVVINDNDGEFLVLDSIHSPYVLYLKPEADNSYYIATALDSTGLAGSPAGEVVVTVYEATPVMLVADKKTFLVTDPGYPLSSSPTGAVFSGPGVIGSTFYPSIATAEGAPHPVECILTNQYGCVSSDTVEMDVLAGSGNVVLVSGNDTINAVCDDGGTYYIRGSNVDEIPGTFDLINAVTLNPVPGHITDTIPDDDEALFNPVALSGAFDIVYSYEKEGVSVSTTFRLYVNDLGTIPISTLPDTVCRNDAPYLLIPELLANDPGAVFSFTGPAVSGTQSEGYYFDPASPDAATGKNTISMDYTSSNGCITQSEQEVLIGYIPTLDFSLDPVCLPQEGGTVSFKNLTSGKFSVEKWKWNFGDLGSGEDNTSELEHPDHFYPEPGYRKINLTATTFDGCVTSYTIDTVLSDQPVADFTWLNDCYVRGQRTELVDRSVSSFTGIDSLVWTFKTKTGGILGVIGTGSSEDTIRFPFTSKDQYVIELQVENEVGCPATKTRELTLLNTYKLNSAGYEEQFNGETVDWTVLSDGGLESWVLTEPDFDGFAPVEGDLAWHTVLPENNEGYLEHSWIQSPCFDFTGMSSPLIQIDMMKSFVPGTDGAVLQYQDLVSEGWKTVGAPGEGVNWYNQSGIYNEPGGSSFGWGLALFEPDMNWVSAAHGLDQLVGRTHVKFRVSVATSGSRLIAGGKYNQGFAFDNVYIGERHRKSVLEYFTNASSAEAYVADSVVDAFVAAYSGELIDLQYHMDIPQPDDMNENNPFPASTRSFSYGIPGVPYAVLNGGTSPGTRFDFSGPSQVPDSETLKETSLEIPLFDMFLQVDYLETGLEGEVRVTCRTDAFASNVQLYLVVIEREVTSYTGINQDTSFRNVVLDMIPSPGGTLLGSDWSNGKKTNIVFNWEYASFVEDVEDLSVVAFIQDRDKGTILQADQKPHTPGVGIREESRQGASLLVYPNPARDYLYVDLGTMPTHEGELQVTDLSGRLLLRSPVYPQQTVYRLNVSSVAEGFYLVRLVYEGEMKQWSRWIRTR